VKSMSLVVVVFLSLGACRPSVPEQLRYRIVLKTDSAQGVEVERDGTVVGTVTAAGAVELTTPSTLRPTGLRLSARLPTPCGPMTVPLTLATQPSMDLDGAIAQAMKSQGVVLVDAQLPERPRTLLLVDGADGKQPLRVGQATLPVGAKRFSLFVGEHCAPTATVTLGDVALGTWRAHNPTTFVSAADACHQLSSVGYGDAVAGPPVLFKQRVRALRQVPDYFLEKAPSSVSSRGAGARYVTELVRAECGTGAEPSEVARKAFDQGGCLEAVPALRRAVAWNDDDLDSTAKLVGCLAKGVSVSEAQALATACLATHPEAVEQLQTALDQAGHPEVRLGGK